MNLSVSTPRSLGEPALSMTSLGPIYRIHVELADMVADEMDILSLLHWRATCRANYGRAKSSLRRALTTRLRLFVPESQRLADLVSSNGGVFGGELALSFILRLESYRLASMDIYTSTSQFESLCDAILDDSALRRRIDSHMFLSSSPLRVITRLVAQSLTIHLSNGRTIRIHQSYTSSPTAPVTRLPCTALSNYVTSYGFGCSHPELTLAHRSLLADRELVYISAHDSNAIDLVLSHNFSLAVSPTAWPEYRRDMNGRSLISPEECWRHRFICPNQGRYFGDGGSLVAFYDPLGGDIETCRQENIPPFGPMTIWRLLTTFQCDDGCEYLDGVVDRGMTSIPVMFKNDPRRDVSQALSDRYMHTYSLYRTFGWRVIE